MSIIEIEGKKYKLTPVEAESPTMFKFGPNGEGYFVGGSGYEVRSAAKSSIQQIELYGNCFPTKETARKARDMMRVQNLFISAALVVDPEAGPYTDGRAWSCIHTNRILAANKTLGCPAYVHTFQQAEQLRDLLQSIGWPNNLEPMP